MSTRKPSEIIITALELLDIIRDQCCMRTFDCLEFDDNIYRLPHHWEIGELLRTSRIDRTIYEEEFGDCDDYVKQLVGEASKRKIFLGNIKVRIAGMRTAHKLCLTVTSDKKVWFIEPQKDECLEPSKRIQILKGVI